jgi:hypothetical protein
MAHLAKEIDEGDTTFHLHALSIKRRTADWNT